MQITSKTRCREVMHLMSPGKLEEFMKLPEVPILEPFRFIKFMDMPIWMLDWILDHMDKVVRIIRILNPRLLDFAGKVKGLKSSMKGIEAFLKQYQTPQTKQEKLAMRGISFPDFTNQMLIDVIEFYHLRSSKEASRMKIKEWMLCAQSKMSKNKFQAELNRIQAREAEAARKGKK